jgi:hypothetical protein
VEQTFAPSFAAYRGTLNRLLPAFAIFLILGYWRVHQPLPIYATEAVGLVVLLAGYLALYFRNTRVEAARLSLTPRNAFGFRHTVAESNLATVVIVENFTQSSGYPSSTSRPRLLVLDPEGRSVLRWSGLFWSREQMDELAKTLGLPIAIVSGTTTARALTKSYPRALSSIEVHPVIWGLAIALVITVVVIIWVFTTVQ